MPLFLAPLYADFGRSFISSWFYMEDTLFCEHYWWWSMSFRKMLFTYEHFRLVREKTMALVCHYLKLLLWSSGGLSSERVPPVPLPLSVHRIHLVIPAILVSLIQRFLPLNIPEPSVSFGSFARSVSHVETLRFCVSFPLFLWYEWPFCILCVLSTYDAHESSRYVGACILDRCVDGAVGEEGVIKIVDPIALKVRVRPLSLADHNWSLFS